MSSAVLYRPAPAASLPATLINAGTTELPVLNPSPVESGINPTPGPSGLPLLLVIPSGNALEGKAFGIEASGFLTTTATSTVTAKLYAVPSTIINAGTAATLANSSVLGTSGAVAQNTARAPWVMKASNCIFDSGSGKLTGKVEWSINNTIVAAAAFTTVIASINNGNDPIVGFLLTTTPSAGIATLNVTEFAVDF